jgi:hypothetical protein
MVVELTVWSLCAVAWPLAAFFSTRLLQGKADRLNPLGCGSGMFILDPGSEFFPSRIRIFSIPDPNFFHPGSEFFPSRIPYPIFSIPDPIFFSIPDPNLFHPGSRIRIKEFKYGI